MKTFDASAPLTTKLAILLIGPSGARKTTLALTFPNVYVIDIDQNLRGPCMYSKPVGQFDSAAADDNDKPLETWQQYDRILDLMTRAKSSTATWVLVDGLSAINQIIADKVMHDQKRDYMEGRDWSSFSTAAAKLLFTKARQMNKNYIFTAHEERITHNDPKNFMAVILDGYEPYLQGGTRERLGGFFTDVWRLEANLAPGDKIETSLTTDKVGLMRQLKNSVGLPHTIKNATYTELHKLSGGLL